MKKQTKPTPNPREAAYLALLGAMREERFIPDALDAWMQEAKPSSRDFHLAQQLAYGSAQMSLALDYIAGQAAKKKKLSLKLKERLILHIALYQYYYLERIPLYAIADEMVNLARKYCHNTFVSFLNAVLRNLPQDLSILPQDDSISSLSIRYSFPTFYVENVIKDYGLPQALQILEAGNTPSPTMVRIRPGFTISSSKNLQTLDNCRCSMAILKDSTLISEIANSPHFYIQNVTPASLLFHLCGSAHKPQKILDLCAAPGGKLIAAHDFFPKAKLWANDVTADKLELINENCIKYGIEANLSCTLGQEFKSSELFDVIILDVPCSNTGVLNKRPEARWRLSKQTVADLEKTQLSLIEHAKGLLSPEGQIWYMTCSILKDENENLIEQACRKFHLKTLTKQTILPNLESWDGGFASALVKQ